MCGVHACVCCGVDYAYMYTYVTCGHLYMSKGDGRCLLLFSALFSCDSISHCSMVFQLIWLASEPLQCDDLLTPSPPGTEGSNQAIHMGAGDLRIQIQCVVWEIFLQTKSSTSPFLCHLPWILGTFEFNAVINIVRLTWGCLPPLPNFHLT